MKGPCEGRESPANDNFAGKYYKERTDGDTKKQAITSGEKEGKRQAKTFFSH